MTAGNATIEPDAQQMGRKRVERIFRFLEAKSQRENKAIRRIEDQQWSLWFHQIPNHGSIVLASREPEAEKLGVILRVRADYEAPCPTPPAPLRPWLERGWEDLNGSVKVFPSQNRRGFDGETEIVLFESDPARPKLLNEWQAKRDAWKPSEYLKRKAMALYEELHRQWGELNREGEKVEFVLGDGILSWAHEDGQVYHPILFQRLELEFDPSKREFRFIESSAAPELYSTLLYEVQQTTTNVLGNAVVELEKGEYHPLGLEEVSAFLQTVCAGIFPRPPEWKQDEIPPRAAPTPVIGRKPFHSPVIFRRKRNLGFSTTLKRVVEAIAAGAEVPEHLLRIAGVYTENLASEPVTERTWYEYVQPKDILLSKDANREQVRIAETLDRTGAVLVQGPPGTGKTHTIANLIGHLLAQGKRILVTSHSTKALRVLREKVEAPLQPLCVSVLDSDATSRGELKESVQHLMSRLTDDPVRLRSEAERLRKQRQSLIEEYYRAADSLTAERRKEYEAIVISGQSFLPIDAARLVAEGIGILDCIPTPVERGSSVPLSSAELSELYKSNHTISVQDENDLSAELPPIENLPGCEAFEEFANQFRDLTARLGGLASVKDYGISVRGNNKQDTIEILQVLASDAASCSEAVKSAPQWQVDIIAASLESSDYNAIWNDLFEQIETVYQLSASSKRVVLENAPRLPQDAALEDVRDIAAEIIRHIESGGHVSKWSLTMRPKWKRLVQNTRVLSGTPCSLEHFLAIHAEADLELRRANLRSRWTRQVIGNGAPTLDHPGRHPEDVLRQYVEPLRRHSSWSVLEWIPLKDRLCKAGVDWHTLYQDFASVSEPTREIDLLTAALSGPLQTYISFRIIHLQHAQLKETAETWMSFVKPSNIRARSNLAETILRTVSNLDVELYRTAYNELQRLQNLWDVYNRRQYLIEKLLRNGAPGWAGAIRAREGLHGNSLPPARVADAWQWRQLSDELYRRRSSSDKPIIESINRISTLVQQTTEELIAKLTWATQIDRCSPPMRSSLAGWLETDKGSRGVGKKAVWLKKEAGRLLNECRGAVPVWIMPLSRVVESFDPRNAPFDVVIIDEASQMDVSGLIALYLAREIVVVGDNEQVSPLAVGENVDAIHQLIQTHLVDIPNAHLYDGRLSIYALAEQSFGCTIRLVEHFRCAPEIISFSNHLCYNGEIKPLRDASAIQLKPHTVEHRVQSGITRDKVNIVEAEEVVSLIIAATEQAEYANKTIGVVSLVGDEQAREIEVLLRRHLPSEAFEASHKILCGNAAQFQGDERDVMFLSVVDSCDDPPLSLRTADLFKQRFNVAASRARDQMWVVHSLEPRTDLKPDDLRRRLIEHAADPYMVTNAIEVMAKRVESDFEREVAQRLIQAGYRVIPQWKVGHYRIDLVIEGSMKRLAVECDGERFHPHEKLEDDLARQAVLERLGWSFVRIRGSYFYRDRNAALEPLFKRLSELGIEKLGNDTGNVQGPESETELLTRVRRRAEELRRNWQSNPKHRAMGPSLRYEEDDLTPVNVTFMKEGPPPVEEPQSPQIEPVIQKKSPRVYPGLPFDDELSEETPAQTRSESVGQVSDIGLPDLPVVLQNGQTLPQPGPSSTEGAIVAAVSAKDWFSIAKWAKDNGHLEGWQRSLSFSLGRRAANGTEFSEKQVRQGVRILEEVRRLGFKSSE